MNYKKMVRCALGAALSITLVTGTACAAFGSGTVTGSVVRLRQEPSTESLTLGNVARGDLVEVLEDQLDGWYRVSVNGQTGYMSADYLDVAEDGGAAAQNNPAPADKSYARVDASALRLRTGAGTDCEQLGLIPYGAVVPVLSSADGWCQVTYNGVTGYVSGDYLTLGSQEELTASSAKGQQMVDIAKKYLGTRYSYGGASPSGFDCSGLVYYVAKSVGYAIPRTGSAMWNAGYTKISRGDLQPGDLVFFTGTGGSHYITHVGLYIGGNQFIHSSSPSSGGVIISSLNESYYAPKYVGACRL